MFTFFLHFGDPIGFRVARVPRVSRVSRCKPYTVNPESEAFALGIATEGRGSRRERRVSVNQAAHRV